MTNSYQNLCNLLQAKESTLYIALSGGIDSLTLMTVAARIRNQPTIAMHAVSAAVPIEATERCRVLAAKYHWQLREIDALEFENSNYVSNPHNRCYYCKNSLFTAINACSRIAGEMTIATGTNADDLGDYRPGLKAAAEQRVWQPYVEAEIDKNTIRSIARDAGLGNLANLPAAPCLSSRIETGISIDSKDLLLIHKVENLITQLSLPGDIRCRILKRGVVVQLPVESPLFSNLELKVLVTRRVDSLCVDADKPFLGFEYYKKGSAFIKPEDVTRAGI